MCKIPVVGCQPSGQFPDPFDWIQLRAVGRQKQKTETLGAIIAPIRMQDGMMEAGIIGQHHDPSVGMGADLTQPFHKDPKRLCIKGFQFTLIGELSISETYGTKVADTFSRWVVQHNGILAFGRNPHSTPGAMLLKMHFIQGPDISRAAEGNLSDFF
jgi:hypothetical protein